MNKRRDNNTSMGLEERISDSDCPRTTLFSNTSKEKCRLRNLREILSSRPIRSILFVSISLLMIVLIVSEPVEAGGVVARRQQMQQQIQQQRALQQQQVVAQQQAAIQQQQQIAVRQAQQEAIQVRTQAQIQAQTQAQAHLPLRGGRPAIPQDKVEEVVGLNDVIRSLEVSSRAWALVIDQDAKEAIVSEYMERYRRIGVYIGKPPTYYATMIDAMSQENPTMLTRPFDQVMRVMAIIEYDFQNGQDKDAMALQVLGTREAVMRNKQRLGLR